MMVEGLFVILVLHRVGILSLFLSSIIPPILPSIFPKPSDEEFSRGIYQATLRISQLSLVDLVITGLLRLTYGIPNYIEFKLILAAITIILFFSLQSEFNTPEWLKLVRLRFVSVIVTAAMGLVLYLTIHD